MTAEKIFCHNWKSDMEISVPNKIYYLNFTLDHLIKLDYNFIYSTVIFTDDNGVDYILNKLNKSFKNKIHEFYPLTKELNNKTYLIFSKKSFLIF